MTKTIISVLIGMVLLSGCVGPLVPIVKVSEKDIAQIQNVKVYDNYNLPSPNAAIIKDAVTYSCKNKLWSKDATNEDAIDQMKVLAIRQGGDAVFIERCEITFAYGSSGINGNCWSLITCNGQILNDAK